MPNTLKKQGSEAGGRRQEAGGRRQEAGGSPYEKNFFTTMHENPSIQKSL
ncbi:MAG: hypothetical protein F6K41_30870 [Symploca sp. SIO3E6]|nr:hypothetical protein [Caldora sp. SIO3E6]